jgi:hypothetical protein
MTDVGTGTLPESSRKTGIPKQTPTLSRIVNERHGIADRPARSQTLRGGQLLMSDHCPVLVTQQVVHLSVAMAAVLDHHHPSGRTHEAHGSPVKYRERPAQNSHLGSVRTIDGTSATAHRASRPPTVRRNSRSPSRAGRSRAYVPARSPHPGRCRLAGPSPRSPHAAGSSSDVRCTSPRWSG